MKKMFTHGDHVDIKGLDESVIKAIEARFVADGYEGFDGLTPKESIGVVNGCLRYRITARNKISQRTVEQILFAGSPKWVIDVVDIVGKLYWTNGVDRMQDIESGVEAMYEKGVGALIATRQKSEPLKTVADAAEAFKNRWPRITENLDDKDPLWGSWCWCVTDPGSREDKSLGFNRRKVCTREEFKQHVKEKAVKRFDVIWLNDVYHYIGLNDSGDFIFSSSAPDYPILNRKEFGQISKEVYSSPEEVVENLSIDENSWHERGERPPIGTECEVMHKNDDNPKWELCEVVLIHNGNHIVCYKPEPYYAELKKDAIFRPIKKTKIIDMSLFAGSDVWVSYSGNAYQAKHLTFEYPEQIIPTYKVWNAVKGLTEKPRWCKGFNVTVRVSSGYEHSVINDNVQDWSDVVAIRFDGVKEGYEYPKSDKKSSGVR